MDSVYSTGEMGWVTKEQALILDIPQGLIVITGCAHPNVADMAKQAQAYLGKNIYLLILLKNSLIQATLLRVVL